MQDLISTIQGIADKINDTEKKRLKLADFINQLPKEMNIKKTVNIRELKNIKIAAVDGGIVKKSLHGMDCMLVRAAATCFHYNDNKISKVEYYPSRNPTPRPEVYEALSEIDWNQFSSINRLKEEITTAIESIDQLKPNILLIDGLIMPHQMDRPSKTSLLYRPYMEIISLYKTLFDKAIKHNVVLAGIIEDSRNTIFCDHIKSEILSKIQHQTITDLKSLLTKTSDTNLLYLILEKGERSTSFHMNNPLSLDLNFPPMKTFYLKTAKYDRPLKIDYLPQLIDEDTLSSIILSISGHHQGYGIPTPLIEADNVAKLSEFDMENFYSNILSLTNKNPNIMMLRREQRPF